MLKTFFFFIVGMYFPFCFYFNAAESKLRAMTTLKGTRNIRHPLLIHDRVSKVGANLH